MSKFDFSDLLALILAIFSIWLSVSFYHKATDTSNLFYDNTHKFTKDVSIILGRIEAGFGERLKHLDEGYSGLKDVIYNNPNNESATKEKKRKKWRKLIRKRKTLLTIYCNEQKFKKWRSPKLLIA